MPDSEIESFHTRTPGKLPQFRYAGPDLHYKDSAVLLGDTIHTVKPYFGLGVNSALEDVKVLWEKLQEHPVRLPCYPEAKCPVAEATERGPQQSGMLHGCFCLHTRKTIRMSSWSSSSG
jgi:2-polyprenyl-6-methoxyphenol hydroxylase-like FAD-dependent oxidoreductase